MLSTAAFRLAFEQHLQQTGKNAESFGPDRLLHPTLEDDSLNLVKCEYERPDGLISGYTLTKLS